MDIALILLNSLIANLIDKGFEIAGNEIIEYFDFKTSDKLINNLINDFISKNFINNSSDKKEIKQYIQEIVKEMGKDCLNFDELNNIEFCNQFREKLNIFNEDISDENIIIFFNDVKKIIYMKLPSNVRDSINRNSLLKHDENTNMMYNKISQALKEIKTDIVGIEKLSFDPNFIDKLKQGSYIVKISDVIVEESFDDFLDKIKKVNNERNYKELIGRKNLLDDIEKWINGNKNQDIMFCSLIGPGGAGKTHIALEIMKKGMCGFQPYYFEKKDFNKLKNYTTKWEEININMDTMFILDYVYEQINIIENFIYALKTKKLSHKVIVMFIERDSTMECVRHIIPQSKKFYINSNKKSETNNSKYYITDDDLKIIMKNSLDLSVKFHRGIDDIIDTCVKQLVENIDPSYKRPIFIIFLAEICNDEIQNNCDFKMDINSIDTLLEKYWMWKTRIEFDDNQLKELDIEEVEFNCIIFAKILLICATVLGHKIILTKYSNIYKVDIEGSVNYKKEFINLIEKYMHNIDDKFLNSNAFVNYFEKICKTNLYVLQNTIITIGPEKDILSEWLIYQEIKDANEIETKDWFKDLIITLMNFATAEYAALAYRGGLDFPQIIDLFRFSAENATLDDIINKTKYMILGLVKKELIGDNINKHYYEIEELLLDSIIDKNRDIRSNNSIQNEIAFFIRTENNINNDELNLLKSYIILKEKLENEKSSKLILI